MTLELEGGRGWPDAVARESDGGRRCGVQRRRETARVWVGSLVAVLSYLLRRGYGPYSRNRVAYTGLESRYIALSPHCPRRSAPPRPTASSSCLSRGLPALPSFGRLRSSEVSSSGHLRFCEGFEGNREHRRGQGHKKVNGSWKKRWPVGDHCRGRVGQRWSVATTDTTAVAGFAVGIQSRHSLSAEGDFRRLNLGLCLQEIARPQAQWLLCLLYIWPSVYLRLC